jgi:hypothetical protein
MWSRGGGNINIQILENTTSAMMKTTNIAAVHNITYENTAGLVQTNPPVLAITRTVKTHAAMLAGR